MLKKYTVRTGHSWGIFVIDTSNGFFAVVSDYGNYSYIWSAPGMCFRKFLCQIDSGYLFSKLMHMREGRQYLDEDETRAAIAQRLESYTSCEYYEAERTLLEDSSFEDAIGFHDWYRQTQLDCAWELAQYRSDPMCTGFCENLYPHFVAQLKAELAEEARGLSVA